MSATEKHRQKRRSERAEQTQATGSRDIAKTNPSALKLPIEDDNYEIPDEEVVERMYKSETVAAPSKIEENDAGQNGNSAGIGVKTTIMVVAGASSILFIVASLTPL